QALMQFDHRLRQGSEEASGQAALLGEQGLDLQTKQVRLLLELLEFATVRLESQAGCFHRMQRVFLIMSLVDGRDHLVSHGHLTFRMVQVVLQHIEERKNGAVDAQGRPTAVQVMLYLLHMGLEPVHMQRSAQLFGQAQQQALIGTQAQQPPVVQVVLDAYRRAQPRPYLRVVAPPFTELELLFQQLAQPLCEHLKARGKQAEYLADHLPFEQLFLMRDDALAQQGLQVRQPTAFNQRDIAAYLAQQRLLGGQRQYAVLVEPQLLGGKPAYALDFTVHMYVTGQIVPEHVDLVQHGEQALRPIFIKLPDMLLPDH